MTKTTLRDRRPAAALMYRKTRNRIVRRVTSPATSPAVANVTDTADVAVRVPLISLFAGQFIQGGEIVQFVVKPSRWSILLNSMLFAASVVLIITALHFLRWQLLFSGAASLQLTVFLIAGRLVWASLQWMGTYYVLTDMRVIRLSGVFDVEVASIPLRKVSEVKLYRWISERLLAKGSIEITAEGLPVMAWNTVSRPVSIHERVVSAVSKAQQNGHSHP